eukprot:scaffold134909_cov28-Tisochrysis_lutea.AAC.1
MAARHGHEACVLRLLEAKAELESLTAGRYTALACAARHGHEACLRALVEARASVDCVSNRHASPVHCAVACGSETCLHSPSQPSVETVDARVVYVPSNSYFLSDCQAYLALVKA